MIVVDVRDVRALLDRGGLLRVTVPSGSKDGPLALALEIRTWIARVGTIDENPELKPFLPAVEFLKEELSARLETLTNSPAPED